jgi:hypothetical protein
MRSVLHNLLVVAIALASFVAASRILRSPQPQPQPRRDSALISDPPTIETTSAMALEAEEGLRDSKSMARSASAQSRINPADQSD